MSEIRLVTKEDHFESDPIHESVGLADWHVNKRDVIIYVLRLAQSKASSPAQTSLDFRIDSPFQLVRDGRPVDNEFAVGCCVKGCDIERIISC